MTLETTANPIPDYQRSARLLSLNVQRGGRWVIAGAAPGVRAAIARVPDIYQRAAIGCNDALDLPMPLDVYLIHDTLSARLRFGQLTEIAKRDARPMLCATEHCYEAVAPLRPLMDERFEIGRPYVKSWQPGRLCNPMASGALCAQLAVLHGATDITLIGMTGYRSTPQKVEVDYDNGSLGTNGGVMQFYAPFMRSLIEQTPDIQWTSVGRPLWLDPEQRLFNFKITEI